VTPADLDEDSRHALDTDPDGETFVVRTDGRTATEIAKEDTFGNARRVGYVADVIRMGWM